MSFQWCLTFGPPDQNPINTSPLPHACHMSCPPQLPVSIQFFPKMCQKNLH
jgi:hypothetical protein